MLPKKFRNASDLSNQRRKYAYQKVQEQGLFIDKIRAASSPRVCRLHGDRFDVERMGGKNRGKVVVNCWKCIQRGAELVRGYMDEFDKLHGIERQPDGGVRICGVRYARDDS